MAWDVHPTIHNAHSDCAVRRQSIHRSYHCLVWVMSMTISAVGTAALDDVWSMTRQGNPHIDFKCPRMIPCTHAKSGIHMDLVGQGRVIKQDKLC